MRDGREREDEPARAAAVPLVGGDLDAEPAGREISQDEPPRDVPALCPGRAPEAERRRQRGGLACACGADVEEAGALPGDGFPRQRPR